MLAVIGENVVDMFRQANGDFRPRVGGSPLNVAVGAALQQVPALYLSPISSDAMGDDIHAYLQQRGVQLPGHNRSPLPSSLAFVTFSAQGQPSYSLYRRGIADRDISADQLIALLPRHCKVLHTGSLALEPLDAAIVLPVLKTAKAWGMWVSVDLNVRLNFVSDAEAYRRHLLDVIALADIIKASDEDLALLFPTREPTSALAYLQTLAPKALIAYTLGADGAALLRADARIDVAGIAPTPFVDTVGAGDTFFANLLAGLMPFYGCAGLPPLANLHSVLQRANLAASLNVSRVGCQPPTKAELDQAMALY